MIAVERLEEWDRAAVLLAEWQALDPGDSNASAWAPRIANRRRAAGVLGRSAPLESIARSAEELTQQGFGCLGERARI